MSFFIPLLRGSESVWLPRGLDRWSIGVLSSSRPSVLFRDSEFPTNSLGCDSAGWWEAGRSQKLRRVLPRFLAATRIPTRPNRPRVLPPIRPTTTRFASIDRAKEPQSPRSERRSWIRVFPKERLEIRSRFRESGWESRWLRIDSSRVVSRTTKFFVVVVVVHVLSVCP